MLDYIISIPGKDFIYLFALLWLGLNAVAWYYSLDGSLRFGIPSITRFDSLSIAALEGLPHVIRTSLFGLWSRDQIQIDQTDDQSRISAKSSPKEGKGPVDTRILQFLEKPRKTEELFQNGEFQEDMKQLVEPMENRLKNAHLLKDFEETARGWKILIFTVLILLGVGATKLILGTQRSKPVGWLILEIIIGVTFLILSTRPWRKTTDLGTRYLDKMKKHFEWVKNSIQDGKLPEGLEPEIAVALFGTALLSSTIPFSAFSDAFKKQHRNGGGCGGCGPVGGGCGGGGCGGGCGGCGGCGG